MITEILLLLLHLMQGDRLRNIRKDRTHQIERASAAVHPRHRHDRRHIITDLAEYAIRVRSGIRDLLLEPFRLLFRGHELQAVALPFYILGAPLIDGFNIALLFFNIISVLCIIVIPYCNALSQSYPSENAVCSSHSF